MVHSGRPSAAGGIRAREERLKGIINPTIAPLWLPCVTSNTILSAERSALMDTNHGKRTRLRAGGLGLGVLERAR